MSAQWRQLLEWIPLDVCLGQLVDVLTDVGAPPQVMRRRRYPHYANHPATTLINDQTQARWERQFEYQVAITRFSIPQRGVLLYSVPSNRP